MRNCTVCGSGNLNEFCQTRGPKLDSAESVWWCEDCGSMHTDMGVSCPEFSMLHHQVLAFHKRFGQSIGDRPQVLDEKTLRFRLSLIAEEFLELLEAALPTHVDSEYLREARENISWLIEHAAIGRPADDAIVFDLPAFVDALADMAYVMEGTAISMGVNMTPIAAEVHRANMAKLPSYVAAKDAMHRGDAEAARALETANMVMKVVDALTQPEPIPVKREDGKVLKPPGWKPPDIEGELHAQGWRPMCLYCGSRDCHGGCRT